MISHDVVLTREEYADIGYDLYDTRHFSSLREHFLHYPPYISYFSDYGGNSFPWRHELDFDKLLDQVWRVCQRTNVIKHGGFGVPFHLDLDVE